MMKIAGSRSTLQRHGSADPDPDPHQNVMDPQHWFKVVSVENDSKPSPIRALFSRWSPPQTTKLLDCAVYWTQFTQWSLFRGSHWRLSTGCGTKSHHGNISQNGHLHRLQNCRIAQYWTKCKQWPLFRWSPRNKMGTGEPSLIMATFLKMATSTVYKWA